MKIRDVRISDRSKVVSDDLKQYTLQELCRRKSTNDNYCVVCQAHTNGAGITSPDGVFICLNCAETIYDVMTQFHHIHLDNCDCHKCRKRRDEE